MHFIRPFWLLALIPLGSLWWFWARGKSQRSAWQAVCDPHLLPALLVGSAVKYRLYPLILGFSWLLAVIALAGPSWSKKPEPIYRNESAQVIILDLSPAMNATDIAPDRLTRAKFKLRDIFARSREGSLGLIVYSDEPFLVSPLTQDAKTIEAMLPVLKTSILPVVGSQLMPALQMAEQVLTRGGAKQGNIIVVTSHAASQGAITFARELKAKGITLAVLGVGTEAGAPIPTAEGFEQDAQGNVIVSRLNKRALTTLAAAGGGVFTLLSKDDRDINVLLSGKSQRLSSQHKGAKQTSSLWHDEGYWFILILLLLCALLFRRGWIDRVVSL